MTRHVLDDDLDLWDYLIETDTLEVADVEYLHENGRLDTYRDRIPDSMLARANVAG